MSGWLTAIFDYLKAQWPGFVTGAILGWGALVSSAISRVVRDWYQRRLTNEDAVAAACTECIQAVELFSFEVEKWYVEMMEIITPSKWEQDYESAARKTLALNRALTGNAFFIATNAYLECYSNLATHLERGWQWWEWQPKIDPDVLRTQMMEAIPSSVRERVAPGWAAERAAKERQQALAPIKNATRELNAMWARTKTGGTGGQ